jgi:predicted amidophosphoribosyltransferase
MAEEFKLQFNLEPDEELCYKCGVPVKKVAAFCYNCGVPLDKKSGLAWLFNRIYWFFKR